MQLAKGIASRLHTRSDLLHSTRQCGNSTCTILSNLCEIFDLIAHIVVNEKCIPDSFAPEDRCGSNREPAKAVTLTSTHGLHGGGAVQQLSGIFFV